MTMWFKNLKVFRLNPTLALSADLIEQALQQQPFVANRFSDTQPLNMGWVPVFADSGLLSHRVGNCVFAHLRLEKKLLPASVINQHARQEADKIAEEQGFPVGRKRMKELKENAVAVLRPQAFSIYRETQIYFDLTHRWLCINAASDSKADEIIAMLAQVLEPMPIQTLQTQQSPVHCMSQWLLEGEAPNGFSLDQETELKANDQSKATVRYSNHSPEPEELQKHLQSGKQCTKLALTWNDRISLVLNESMTLKRITPTDFNQEEDVATYSDPIEQFDQTMSLMTGEFNAMLQDLVLALGGERSSSKA